MQFEKGIGRDGFTMDGNTQIYGAKGLSLSVGNKKDGAKNTGFVPDMARLYVVTMNRKDDDKEN